MIDAIKRILVAWGIEGDLDELARAIAEEIVGDIDV